MFTHEIFTKNDSGEWEHLEYASAWQIAADVCSTYPGEETPQDILNILSTAHVVNFGPTDDMMRVVRLADPLFENQYGELRTAGELEDEEHDWQDYQDTMDSISSDWWKAVDKASRNGFAI